MATVNVRASTKKGADAPFRQSIQNNPGEFQLPADGYETENVDGPLDITSVAVNPSPKYSESDLRERAAKTEFASGGSISFSDAYSKLQSGMEDDINQTLYKQAQIDRQKRKVNVMKELVNQAGSTGVNEATLAAVRGLSATEIDDPDQAKIALENAFAKQYVNQHVANNQNNTNMVNQAGDKGLDMLDVTQEAIARGQIANTQLARVKAIEADQSWVGWGVDLGKQLVPGYSWYKKNNIVTNAPTSGILPGANIQEQINYLYGLPPAEMNKQLGAALDALSRDNPQLAVEFATAVQNYSRSSALFDNLMATLDIASVGELAVVGAKAGARRAANKAFGDQLDLTAQNGLKQSLRDAVGAANAPVLKVEDAVAAAGDLEQSSIVQAVKATRLKESAKTNLDDFDELVQLKVPSIANPTGVIGPSRLAKNKANAIGEALEANAKSLIEAVTRPNVVSRIDEGTRAFQTMIDETLKKVEDLHSVTLNNGIQDVRAIPNTRNTLNSSQLEIDLTRPTGELFESPEAADTFARQSYKLRRGDYEVKQQGGGYFLRIQRDMDETSTGVRDVLIETENKNPETITNAYLGFLRSADNVVSTSQNEARKTATYAAEEMQKYVKMAAETANKQFKGIGGKTRYDRVNRILSDNRDQINPKTGHRGVFYNDLASFEEGWFKMFNSFPNEKDALAYFTARQLSDFDYLVRNIEVYSYKARKGVQNVEVYTQVSQDGTNLATVYSKRFEGRFVDSLPEKGEGHRIWIVDEKGQGRIVEPMRMSTEERTELFKALKDENYRYVQVYDPINSGLSTYTKDVSATSLPTNFVVSKNFRASKLEFTEQVPYREGSHVVYDTENFIKQPKIVEVKRGQKVYQGDTTFSAHTIRAEADEFVEDLNKARVMLKDSDPNLQNFVTTKLGMSLDEFRKAMKDFELDQPFINMRNGQTIKNFRDLRNEGIVDLTDSQYNMAQEMRTKFLSEKGDEVMTFEKGSQQNPVWKQEKARMMDPLRVINNSVRQVTDAIIYNNYKMKSAEEFVAQFGDLLEGGTARLQAAPMYHLYNPQWKKGSDPVRLAAAQRAQTAMMQLVETPTSVRSAWMQAKNAFINSTYKSLGRDAAEYVDESALFRTRDPIRFIRSASFHTTLGLFNPIQFFLQIQTLGNMSAISPRFAAQAHKDMILMNMMRMSGSDEVRNYFAKLSGNKHYAETWNELLNSGYLNVRGATTYIDDVSDPKLFQGRMGTVLDAGTAFFRYGEQLNRISSFNIAMREWRAANPTAKIDDIARRGIITRADDLTTNMSRASNASLQNGFGSVPLQFFSYHWRLLEQIWTGAKGTGALSRSETARLLMWSGMAYGIPVGVLGPVTGVWPWYESIEKYAQENGINLDANLFTQTFMRGGIETILNYMTGENWNFSDRYGPGGMPTLKQIVEGEKGVEALLGVSGSVIGRIYQNLSPALFGVSTAFNTDENKFPLSSVDVIDALRSIATVNNAQRSWMAYNLGAYESRTGIKLFEGPGGDDAWPVLLGMQPRDGSKLIAKKDVLKEQNDQLKNITALVTKEISRALKADSPEDAEVFFKRARVYIASAGQLTPKQKNDMMASVLKNFTDEQINTINLRWIKASPSGDIMNRRIQLMEQENRVRQNAAGTN